MRRSQDSVGQASNEPVDRRTAKYEEKRHVAACQNRGRCPTKERKFITIWGVAHESTMSGTGAGICERLDRPIRWNCCVVVSPERRHLLT